MTIEEKLACLGRSKFRGRFKLTAEDRAYIERVGWGVIEAHAADFVRGRLAPAYPLNDGRQTPMRGHPVFKAMHATAMCCRGCMEKWWGIPQGQPLTLRQQEDAVNLLMAWIHRALPAT